MTPITRFLGDGDHAFALPFDSLKELEKATSTTIGLLFERVRLWHFAITDLTETIRLALIGGGATPKDAFELTRAYVAGRPIKESYPLVLEILSAVYFGDEPDTATDEAANG